MRGYRHAGLSPIAINPLWVYRQWQLNSPIGNNGEWRQVATDVSIFVTKRCEVEIESVRSVGMASQKLPKSRQVVSKVAHLGT